MNTSLNQGNTPAEPPRPDCPHRLRAALRNVFGRLLVVCCIMLPAVARADDCGPAPGGPPTACASSSPASTGGNGGPSAGAGNPINVITGNKYQREEDLPALPGVLGLEIVRHYNSAYSKPGSPNGPMGREWKLSYETEVFDKNGRIQVLQADGGRIIFNRHPNNPSLCSTLLPANGRMTVQPRPNGAVEYTWTWTNGRRLHFNSAGKLERIVAPTGEEVDLYYRGDNTLVKVVDPQGRSLTLNYLDREHARANDRFRGVQYIDSPEGRFAYEYGSVLPKGSVQFDARNLLANMVRVTLPSSYRPDQKTQPPGGQQAAGRSVSRVYHHEDPRFPWLLTGISIETSSVGGKPVATRFATFGYDGNARANLSTHANNVDKVTLDTREGGKTVLTNSLGQQTVYRYTIIGEQHRMLEVRGAGCSTCDETNVRYGYDRLGQLTETTKLDLNGAPLSTTRSELDKLGRTVRVGKVDYQNGKPGPVQWLLRLEYLGDSGAPVVIARPSVVPGRELQTRITYNDVGQPLSVTDTGWVPTYDGKQAAGALERTTSYRYALINGRSLLTRIDGPLANGKTNSPLDSDVTVFEYDSISDADNEKKVVAGPRNLAQYDERKQRRDGLLTRIIAPGNFASTFEYDAAGRIAVVSNAAGRTTRLSYTPRGQLLNQTRDGVTFSTVFDGLDNAVEVGYSNAATYQALTRFGYDAAGRPVWQASHLGIFTSRRYDTEDQVLETVTQSSTIRQVRRYTYDPMGHLLAATDVGAGTWRIAWSERGLPDEFTDALGRVTRYRYDAAGRVAGVTQMANTPEALLHGTETRFELDVNGRPVGVVTPNGATTRYVRDDFGQTRATISPNSGMTSKQFDAAGRVISSTDAAGNQADYEYDVAGRITRQTITEAKAAAVRRQTVTTWRYAGERLVAIDHPEQAERYSYDANGRLIVKTVHVTLAGGAQANYSTRYRYDNLGQLVGVSLPDGSLLEYQRNGQNQVVGLDRNRVRTSWLQWLLPRQHIVKELERDVVGLKHLTYGNGIEALYQRSKEGALARIVYRDPRVGNAAPQRSAALETLLGISQAVAAPAPLQAAKQPTPPGALAVPPDPAALLDHRYLWDVQGNLLHTKDKEGASGYAYDALDRLIAAGTVSSASPQAATFDRYYFNAGGNRLLAQEGIANQSDTRSNTVKTSYAPDSDRWQGAEGNGEQVAASYDAAGQPERIGARSYVWDALGKLLEVRQGQDKLASYRYNHRGERIAKDVRGRRTYYLYDDGRNLLAELDDAGKVNRQYVYLAGRPVAVIDTATGADNEENRAPLAQAMGDIAAIWRAWFGQGETVAFLLNNHLGATELVTNAEGKPVWQAAYTPFGKARETSVPGKPGTSAFKFNLRLPGQYADQETGLYYNDHRYYDPARGRYLTPDPLGLRAGGNGYAYVDGNPLKYIDPSGLILFAFDGTGNSETPPSNESISNVRKFYEAYDQIKNGTAFYITGIGTTNKDMPFAGNVATGKGFDQRVELGFKFLNDYIGASTSTDTVNIDVVGFSRGAAEARVWINALVGKLKDGAYTTGGKSRCVNLRFEGLWDTVPHLGFLHEDEPKYDFSIPSAVKYAVQAVALNEYRGTGADFDMRSIMDSAGQASSSTRIEKGFIGSHSDIGGGFGTGDLSDVALKWMLEQASKQGIAINTKEVSDNGWNIVTNPIVHDKSDNRFTGGVIADTRNIVYGKGGKVLETNAVIDGKKTSDTKDHIGYFPNPYRCGTTTNPDVGLVDMTKYNLWLASYGMTMPTGPIVNNSCKP